MRAERNGWVLRSRDSDAVTFPRTDPAVIVGVVDRDGRILLGANARWQPKRYSAFAGFVEPGESLEAAAAREVWEEAGARITNLRYLGSQPWPFPASLMVAYLAELAPDQDPESVRADGEEIIEVRWFDRNDIRDVVDLLPDEVAIARVIIEEWFGGPLQVTHESDRPGNASAAQR